MKALRSIVHTTIGVFAAVTLAGAQDAAGRFSVSSSDFHDGDPLPISAIYNYVVNGANYCSNTGATGLDESPQLAWKSAPSNTRSLAVTVFDATAGVVHWGMYNISPALHALPHDAGVAGSSFGTLVTNVFGDLSYDGPCPPPGVAPETHHYVFTVWALDEELSLESSVNFPPSALTLYNTLAQIGRKGHVLGATSITGVYSSTPASP